eukprot:TRINITY_DN19900_c0_g1_i1.p1 TRINITY_DN19900_c0_g1~~TRINITY_DN19900_c0_g1_i1.p1  ORF type:complete len:211 (+),score=54.49 TRINITY_DN19900_c0_g1_i1:1-633(+)
MIRNGCLARAVRNSTPEELALINNGIKPSLVNFCELQFATVPDIDAKMSVKERNLMQEKFPDCSVSGVGMLRITNFPHKNGFPAAFVRYECSEQLETLLGSTFEKFCSMCWTDWYRLHAEIGENRDIFPVTWRMFAPQSHRKIMRLILRFYLDSSPNRPTYLFDEDMDFCTYAGSIVKCQVLFIISRSSPPYEDIPFAFYVIVRRATRKQ